MRYIAFIVVIALLGWTAYLNVKPKKEPEPEKEWCEIGTAEDGRVTYNSDKQHLDMWVLVRANGQPLLMARCEDI